MSGENNDIIDKRWIRGLRNQSHDVFEEIFKTFYPDLYKFVMIKNLRWSRLNAHPYMEEHENLRSFTLGIVNFYVLKDRLAVILDEDNKNMFEVLLNFWGTDGKEY